MRSSFLSFAALLASVATRVEVHAQIDDQPALPEPKAVSEAPSQGELSKAAEVGGSELTEPLGLAASGDWLLVIDLVGPEGVVALDSGTRELQGVKAELESAGVGNRFQSVSPGADRGEFFLNNPKDTDLVRLRISPNGPPAVNVESLAKPERMLEPPPRPNGTKILGDRLMVMTLGVSGDQLVASLFSPEFLLAFLAIKDNRVVLERFVGSPLFPEFTAIDQGRHFNRNQIAMHPSDKRIVQAFLHSSRLHIWTRAGRLERMVAGPISVRRSFDYVFAEEYEQFLMRLAQDGRYAYLSVTADADRIYALFSGRLRREFGPRTGYGTQVHVFDWDGHFVGNWTMKDAVTSIVVAGNPPLLWGVRSEPTPAVVGYELPLADRASSESPPF